MRDYVRFNWAQFKTNFSHTIDANGEKIGAVSEDFFRNLLRSWLVKAKEMKS